MAAKQWYSIEIECIKFNAFCTMKVGEKSIVSKVRSYGLAYNVAQFLATIYSPEYFNITIK